jgi:hypothetical protein
MARDIVTPRTKAIPMDLKSVEKTVTSKPVLWGLGAIAVLGLGYWLLSNNQAQSAASPTTPDLSGSYSVPISYQSNGQVATNSGTSATDYTQALVALETQKAGYDYSATIAGLNSQTVLGIVGAQTAQQAIASTNYQTSAFTLSNFLKSGYNGLVGSITGPNGATSTVSLAASTPGGKGSANQILNGFFSSTAAQTAAQTPTATPAQTGSTDATNQLVSASLSTLIHNGGLGVAA